MENRPGKTTIEWLVKSVERNPSLNLLITIELPLVDNGSLDNNQIKLLYWIVIMCALKWLNEYAYPAASWSRLEFWHDIHSNILWKLCFFSYEIRPYQIAHSSFLSFYVCLCVHSYDTSIHMDHHCIFNFADSGKVVPSNSCLLDTIAFHKPKYHQSSEQTTVLILCFPSQYMEVLW